jgi:hypothetical protein
MLDSCENIIMFIIAVVSLATTLYLYSKQNENINSKIVKSRKFGCRYNEQSGCYGTCCSICGLNKECQRLCGADPKCCGGMCKED